MSIKSYVENGKEYWQVYINLRSRRIPTVRQQRRIKEIESLELAQKMEARLIHELSRTIAQKELKGVTWGEVLERWEKYWKQYPTRRFNNDTLRDHVSRMENWTFFWNNKPAAEISIGDARDVLRRAAEEGASYDLRKAIKGTINMVYKWGLEEKFIQGVDRSPARDIDLEGRPVHKMPEILNEGEITQLLQLAEEQDHPWYPVWFVGLNSGMRNGELEALRKQDLSMVPISVAKKLDQLSTGDPQRTYGLIRVQRAWKQKEGGYGPTKAHYWRNVPVNSDLYWWLVEYLPKAKFGRDEHGDRIFPELPYWKRGEQAKVLRLFCEMNGLKSIRFHTLRACFATQLLGQGVPETKVMKIGGWQDVKTMMIYVRLAGIQEFGATEGLRFRSKKSPQFDPENPHFTMTMRGVDELDFSEKRDSISENCSPQKVIALDVFRKQGS